MYPMTVYYGDNGRERNVPTVSRLPIFPDPVNDVLILDQQMGDLLTGLYMHDGVSWRFIMASTYLGQSIVENNPIVVYSQLTQYVPLAVGSISYVNSILFNQSTLPPGSAIYAVRLPASAGPGPEPGGDPDVKVYIAQNTISGHRVVMLVGNAVTLLKSTDVEFCCAAIGVTEGSALSSEPVNVRVRGSMTEVGWTFVAGRPVFCGASGQLTQIQPTTGFSLIVGVATGLNSVFIDIKQPFVLS